MKFSSLLLQYAALPLALLAAAAAAYASAANLLSPIGAQLLVFAMASSVVLLAEKLVPLHLAWGRSPKAEMRTNATSMAAAMMVVDPLVKSALAPLAAFVLSLLAQPETGFGWFPRDWPLWAQIPLAAVVAELAQYSMHRLAHRGGWMWRVHGFHHSPHRINWLNGFRVHPLNLAWHQLAGVLVLILVGAPATAIQALLLFTVVISVFQHANADLRLDGWNRVLATADLHRWHHAADASLAQCNFGTSLVVWDLVFGSYRKPAEASPSGVGLDEAQWPADGYLGWLLHPFRRR